MGTKSSNQKFSYKPSLAMLARGGTLGFCHLSVMHTVLNFLEQPLDPFGTRTQNVDAKTNTFIFKEQEQTNGDKVLNKLLKVGYFDQGRDPISFESGQKGKYQFINILIASLASSFMIAVCVTPIDMIVFKKHAGTTNLAIGSSFRSIWQSTIIR